MHELSLQSFTFEECLKGFQKRISLLAFIMLAMAETLILKAIMKYRKGNKGKQDEGNNYHCKKTIYCALKKQQSKMRSTNFQNKKKYT